MKKIRSHHIEAARQFSRYALAGVANTLLTLAVIFVAKGIFHLNPWISNAAGYVAGFVNSFFLNKNWVFHSDKKWMREAVKFCIGFLLCYALQLLATWLLTEHTAIGDLSWELPGYVLGGYAVATMIGMVVYTLCNFVFNRMVTFR